MRVLPVIQNSLIVAFFCAQTAFSQSGIVEGTSDATKQNTNVIPARGKELCFFRKYDEAHLIKNKKQFLTQLEVSISRSALDANKDEISFMIAGDIRDIENGNPIDSIWSNYGICSVTHWTKPELNCASKHGSIFSLITRESHVTLEVPKNKALALAEEVSDRRVVLSGDDEDNRSYWLFPIPCADSYYFGEG